MRIRHSVVAAAAVLALVGGACTNAGAPSDAITIGAIYAWGFEPSVEPELPPELGAEEQPALVGAPGAAGELGSGEPDASSADGGES